MRVLLVSGDKGFTFSTEFALKGREFNVYCADTGKEGFELAKLYEYDIMLIDDQMPDMSGQALLHQMRLNKIKTPVMRISASDAVKDKVSALWDGADEYMAKPVHPDELAARINAVTRRYNGNAQAIVRFGPLSVNMDTKNVYVNDKRVPLSGKEYQIVELLARNKGRKITKDHMFNSLYGGMDEPMSRTIDIFISRARKKLKQAGAPNVIETVWDGGYRMLGKDEPEALNGVVTDESLKAQHEARYGAPVYEQNNLALYNGPNGCVVATYFGQVVGEVGNQSMAHIAKELARRDLAKVPRKDVGKVFAQVSQGRDLADSTIRGYVSSVRTSMRDARKQARVNKL